MMSLDEIIKMLKKIFMVTELEGVSIPELRDVIKSLEKIDYERMGINKRLNKLETRSRKYGN